MSKNSECYNFNLSGQLVQGRAVLQVPRDAPCKVSFCTILPPGICFMNCILIWYFASGNLHWKLYSYSVILFVICIWYFVHLGYSLFNHKCANRTRVICFFYQPKLSRGAAGLGRQYYIYICISKKHLKYLYKENIISISISVSVVSVFGTLLIWGWNNMVNV